MLKRIVKRNKKYIICKSINDINAKLIDRVNQ